MNLDFFLLSTSCVVIILHNLDSIYLSWIDMYLYLPLTVSGMHNQSFREISLVIQLVNNISMKTLLWVPEM